MKIVIVGTGHLAWNLATRLREYHSVVAVSRRMDRSWVVPLISYAELAEHDPDLVLLCVPDAAIREVSAWVGEVISPRVWLVHTSGAASLDLMEEERHYRGVLWPIRTFRTDFPIEDWQTVPLVYDYYASSAADFADSPFRRLIDHLGGETQRLNEEQRRRLHLAATVGNNFTNVILQMSYRICREAEVDFTMLRELLLETVRRQDGRPPIDLQTGAAARGDISTQESHLAAMTDHPGYADVYRQLSSLIRQEIRLREEE